MTLGGIILFVYRSVLISESFSLWLFVLENVSNHYPQFFNQGGWNKRGGDAKVPKLIITEEVGIYVEGGIFWKKLVYNCNQ